MLSQSFQQYFGHLPSAFSRAPGRINLIGEHVDYTGGFSIPAAINRYTEIAFAPSDNTCRIYSQNFKSEMIFSLEDLKGQKHFSESWKNYVWGAFQLFDRKVGLTAGVSMMIDGKVPMGKGISSSASIELSLLNALNFLSPKKLSDLDLCLMGQQVEHQYAGVKCGLLDQFASQFSRKDRLMLIDFQSMTTTDVKVHPSLSSYAWVLVDSLASRELASSGYLTRVEECARGLKLAGVSHYRELSLEMIDEKVRPYDPAAAKRLEHFVQENKRTHAFAQALKEGNLSNLGEILNAGHQSLSQIYEVSLPILDQIQEKGISISGCVGGRMMGGGFGGCVLFLLNKNSLSSFEAEMLSFYKSTYGKDGELLMLEIADGGHAWANTQI